MLKNLGLVFSSLLFFLLLLEGFLWGLSFFMKEKQKNSEGGFRIVTLGESTTADESTIDPAHSWPRLLESGLREQGRGVSVTNLAVAATNSSIQLKKIREHLDTHKVDLVVTMMGVNESHSTHFQFQKRKSLFKTFNLFWWLVDSLDRKFYKVPYFEYYDADYPWPVEVGFHELTLKGFSSLMENLKEFSSCQKSQYLGMLIGHATAQNLIQKHRSVLVDEVTVPMVELCPDFAFVQLMGLMIYNTFPQEKKLQEMTEKIVRDYGPNLDVKVVSVIEAVNVDVKNPLFTKLLNQYGMGLTEDGLGLAENIKILESWIKPAGAALIVMQYPTMSFQDYKEVDKLRQRPCHENCTLFLENKANFEKALAENQYEDIFVDRFRFTWGHATQKGNSLIVDNLMPLVEDVMDQRAKDESRSQGAQSF